MLWNLKMFLEDKGVTQAELAEAVGVSQAWISYFIRGYKKPSFDVMVRIAKYLNITLDDLLSLIGYKTA